MKILFDLFSIQAASRRFHGGAEYAKSVLERLLDLQEDEVIHISYDPNGRLSSGIGDRIRRSKADLLAVEAGQDLQTLLNQGKYQRLYSPMPYRYPDVDFTQIEFIFTIHGLRLIEMPTDRYELLYDPSLLNALKYAYKNLNTRRYVQDKKRKFHKLLTASAKQRVFVVDSYHTKYSLLSHFPELKPSEVEVIYAPRKRSLCPERGNLSSEEIEKFNVSARQYFLLISADRWHKNAYRAIKAFDELFSDYPQIDKTVLVIGANGFTLCKHSLKNRNRFVFFGYVGELELEALYRHAYSFVFPTLNEGFGYPPLESMKYGTPAICSAITATTEIYGDAVLYFNPFSIREMKNRILWMLLEDGVWERYSALGKERSRLIAARQDSDLDRLCRLILAP
jgi:glycosyltransferase involved in cell wall biosynthesis